MINFAKLYETTEMFRGRRYEYVGDLDTASNTYINTVMSECASYHCTVTTCEERLTEAVLTYGYVDRSINEGALTTIWEGLSKLVEKIVEFLGGIVDKIKAWFSMLTTKTTDWIKVMKPKLEKVRNYPTAGSFQYEIHEWNASYITSTMVSAGTDAVNTRRGDLQTHLDAIGKRLQANRAPDTSTQEEKVNEAEDKRDEEIIKRFAQQLKVSNIDDAAELWKAVELEAKGGSLEKKSVSIKPSMDNMLSAIENYQDTQKRFIDLYDKHLATLTKAKTTITNLGKSAIKVKDGGEKQEENKPDPPQNQTPEQQAEESEAEKESVKVKASVDNANNSTDDINDIVKALTRDISRFETHLNSLKTKNTTWLKEMAQEYMSALAKFSTIKETA